MLVYRGEVCSVRWTSQVKLSVPKEEGWPPLSDIKGLTCFSTDPASLSSPHSQHCPPVCVVLFEGGRVLRNPLVSVVGHSNCYGFCPCGSVGHPVGAP